MSLDRRDELATAAGGAAGLARLLGDGGSAGLHALVPDRMAIAEEMTVDLDRIFAGWSIRPSDLAGGASMMRLTQLSLSGLRTAGYDPSAIAFGADRTIRLPVWFERLAVAGRWAMTPAPDAPDAARQVSGPARCGTFDLTLAGLAMTAEARLASDTEQQPRLSLQWTDIRVPTVAVAVTVEGISEFLNRLVNDTLNAAQVIERIRPGLIEMLASRSGAAPIAGAARALSDIVAGVLCAATDEMGR